MAEYIIKLDPDDLDDKAKLHYLEHGWKYKHILGEIDNQMRAKMKWDDKLSDESAELLDEIRNNIYELLGEYNLGLWDEI